MLARKLGVLLGGGLVMVACYPTDPNELDPAFDWGEGYSDDEGAGVTPGTTVPTEPATVQSTTPTPTSGPGGSTPHIAAPVPGRSVTYAFGVKNARYAAGYHTGDDYATATGSDAIAVRDGVIRWSNDNGGAYGKWIGLEADNGRVYVYCHLSQRIAGVGDSVKAGQILAKTGATGNVTGPHLHFEDHPKGAFVYGQVRKPEW